MTRKQKKLGVKTTKSAIFDDATFGVKNAETEEVDNTEEGSPDSPEPETSTSSKKIATITEDEKVELDQVCRTLDKLTLDLLLLMEYQMEHKVNIEKTMTDGELYLSKARYIMGHKNVTTLQLPTENSFDIQPSLVVEENAEDEAMFGKPRLNLIEREFTKPIIKNDADIKENEENIPENEAKIPDPLKWFGVLVPRDLRSAQSKFKEAVSWAVDCANTQIRIHQTCVKIKQLTHFKKELDRKNEE